MRVGATQSVKRNIFQHLHPVCSNSRVPAPCAIAREILAREFYEITRVVNSNDGMQQVPALSVKQACRSD